MTGNLNIYFVLLRNEASLLNEHLEGIPPTSEGQNEGKDLRKGIAVIYRKFDRLFCLAEERSITAKRATCGGPSCVGLTK